MPDTIPLGQLTIGEKIGYGGFGEVFKAKVEPFKQDFAVKFLNPNPFQQQPDVAKERFIREAEILLRLRHPRITPIYTIGEYEERPYILMEYFNGYNLCKAREVAATPSPKILLDFVERCADALGYAHEQGVVHRDIKPTNLLTIAGDCRVVDFGIAAIMDPEGERFTRTGGTPVGDAFSPPELLEDPRLVDSRCDVYSLAACWFWLLTGRTPHGRNWEDALKMHSDVDSKYESVLMNALDSINNRVQSMDQLMEEVQALRDGESPSSFELLELDDSSASVIGVCFERFSLHDSSISVYELERQLGRALSKVQLGASLRKLKRRELLRMEEDEDDFGNREIMYRLTEDGAIWVENNQTRIESLLSSIAEASASKESEGILLDDDIPF